MEGKRRLNWSEKKLPPHQILSYNQFVQSCNFCLEYLQLKIQVQGQGKKIQWTPDARAPSCAPCPMLATSASDGVQGAIKGADHDKGKN